MSPVILPVLLMSPNQELGRGCIGGGTTWAMGTPFLVTTMTSPVSLTLFRRAGHVALNFDMDTVSVFVTAVILC
jgi:hypothetical protein